jgi:hypothetical protein
MPKIKLIKRMAGPEGNHAPGFVMEVDADIGQQLVDQKAAEWIAPVRQPVIERAVKQPEFVKAEIKHVGAGWYELPNGERVRGKKAAEQAVKG